MLRAARGDVRVDAVDRRHLPAAGSDTQIKAGHYEVTVGGRETYLDLRQPCTLKVADGHIDCFP